MRVFALAVATIQVSFLSASASCAPAQRAKTLPTVPAPLPRVCGHEGWTTYAHDAARTSASTACIDPPLKTTWTFSPPPVGGRKERVEHAIADIDTVYAAGIRGQSPVLHRIEAKDAHMQWTFDSRADIARAHWPTAALNVVMYVDDGVYVMDSQSGTHRSAELDCWGPTLADDSRYYLANTWQEEGPGLFAGAYDPRALPLWKTDKFSAKGIVIPDENGIALDGGTLFHAANYRFPKYAYLTALDPETGAVKWKSATVPDSAPSAGGGRVYMVERLPKKEHESVLVARSQNDGNVVWSTPVEDARVAAPVVAGRLVIVHSVVGVLAFDAQTGEPAWSVAILRTRSASRNATSLAAATGSGALLVTAGGQLHVLELTTGRVRWSGAPLENAKDVHSPVIAGGVAYVVADGTLVRLESTPLE